MAILPPVPHKTPMSGEDGLPTAPWAAWFRQIFARVGGSSGEFTAETVAAALAAHIADIDAAHAASAISNVPTGNMASTNVQGAINLLQTEIDTINANPGVAGPSAYAVAVTNGFVGTQGEWIVSLIGATGATGPTGAAGVQGPTGPPGGAINTQFATSSLDGSIYSNVLNGHVYLLEFGT